jgi:NAD(P)-dependent dehydrogenase (short-subunit alcohol dehydrogenase family)
MQISFAGQTVLITGGSDGIGAGCARVFVEAGASVVISSRSDERGPELAERLSSAGPGTCRFVRCDVADAEALRAMIDGVVATDGDLHVLVNNAGQNFGWRPIDEVTVEEFERILEINLVPYFAGAKFALPFLRRTHGAIVNVGSIVAETGFYWNPDYVAAKGGISSLTKALAIDEAVNGVRVNAVLPGNIMTRRRRSIETEAVNGPELHEFLESWQWLGRSGEPEEVGYAVAFLASDRASFITGATLIVSGGVELGMGRKAPYSDLFHDR